PPPPPPLAPTSTPFPYTTLFRSRTMNGAVRRLVELVVAAGPVERVGVIDGDAGANAIQVAEQLAARYPELTVDRGELGPVVGTQDRKSTRLNSSHGSISYGVFCL